MKLQFNLLDLLLDQLVKGSDVRRLFDSPPSLEMIGFCSGTRRISLIIGVVFLEGDVDLGRLEFVMDPSVQASLISGSLSG